MGSAEQRGCPSQGGGEPEGHVQIKEGSGIFSVVGRPADMDQRRMVMCVAVLLRPPAGPQTFLPGSLAAVRDRPLSLWLLTGTPINRIPIMAKQILDLYMLYKLVTEKGGLVEIINRKIWREITKGLNLPTSITSAAFTLRTQ